MMDPFHLDLVLTRWKTRAKVWADMMCELSRWISQGDVAAQGSFTFRLSGGVQASRDLAHTDELWEYVNGGTPTHASLSHTGTNTQRTLQRPSLKHAGENAGPEAPEGRVVHVDQ